MSASLPILPPERINAAWMTRALRAADHDVMVSEVEFTTVGTGQVGDTLRFNLTYAGAAPSNAPRSIIGKFASTDPQSRAAAQMFNLYQAEALFYQRLAATARIRVPKSYAALFDAESHDFVLLLEDLGALRPGDQMRGCTLEEAQAVTREAARLHASHWEDPALLAADWIETSDVAQGFYTAERMDSGWPAFVDRYGRSLAPDVFRVAELLVRHYASWNAPGTRPHTITHNDLRPDNMLFGTRPGDADIVVVDWQTMNFGCGALDLAYFLGGALDREVRRHHEGALLHAYHDELTAGGVTGYAFEDLMRDYRHMSFAGAVMAIGASMLVKQTERGDRMFMLMLERAAHHVLDLGALDVLPG